jgi:hypothetical protein
MAKQLTNSGPFMESTSKHSIYSLSHEGEYTMAYRPKDQDTPVIEIAGTEAQALKNQAAIALLKAWRAEDAQEQRETWTVVKAALEEDRWSDRPLLR